MCSCETKDAEKMEGHPEKEKNEKKLWMKIAVIHDSLVCES